MMGARWDECQMLRGTAPRTGRGRVTFMQNLANPVQRLLGLVSALALLGATLPALPVTATPAWTDRAPQSSVLRQQDASDAAAGSVGQDGTVNGQPREPSAPATNTINPAAPGQVTLPPGVPGAEGISPNINPNIASGIASTQELTFTAIADTTVFLASPNSPQTEESIASLAMGGPQNAVALISFSVDGISDGVVLGARLTFTGAGIDGGPGGSVGIIYDYVTVDGATANDVPSYESALNVQGVPAWFERVEPAGITQIDVTGSVGYDGALTFVLPGQSEQMSSIYSLESGVPPQLILTVGVPA